MTTAVAQPTDLTKAIAFLAAQSALARAAGLDAVASEFDAQRARYEEERGEIIMKALAGPTLADLIEAQQAEVAQARAEWRSLSDDGKHQSAGEALGRAWAAEDALRALMLRAKANPEVGMGATKGIGGDSYAYTVIKVGKGRVTVQRDRVIGTGGNGTNGTATYRYERDPEGGTMVFYRSKDGGWKNGPFRLWIGTRSEYRDPSF